MKEGPIKLSNLIFDKAEEFRKFLIVTRGPRSQFVEHTYGRKHRGTIADESVENFATKHLFETKTSHFRGFVPTSIEQCRHRILAHGFHA